MHDVLPPWLILPFDASRPLDAAPSRPLLIHLAAVVRGRLEGIVDDRDDERVWRRTRRATWALHVAGIEAIAEPANGDEALLWDETVPPAPWLTWGPGQDVPAEARTRDVARALGVCLNRVGYCSISADAARDAGRDVVWIIGQCLGIRPLLGPIGADEVERMRDRSTQAWRPSRAGGG